MNDNNVNFATLNVVSPWIRSEELSNTVSFTINMNEATSTVLLNTMDVTINRVDTASGNTFYQACSVSTPNYSYDVNATDPTNNL